MTLRIILDTNIYGEIIEEGVQEKLRERIIVLKHDLTIYGLKIIRKELRETSPDHVKRGHSLRLALLELYDAFVQNHELTIKPLAKSLADLYFKEYKRNKGVESRSKKMNDFIIVAQATISRLDIVVSEDNKTMLSNKSRNAYDKVNKDHNLITPNFIGYNEFKNKLF